MFPQLPDEYFLFNIIESFFVLNKDKLLKDEIITLEFKANYFYKFEMRFKNHPKPPAYRIKNFNYFNSHTFDHINYLVDYMKDKVKGEYKIAYPCEIFTKQGELDDYLNLKISFEKDKNSSRECKQDNIDNYSSVKDVKQKFELFEEAVKKHYELLMKIKFEKDVKQKFELFEEAAKKHLQSLIKISFEKENND